MRGTEDFRLYDVDHASSMMTIYTHDYGHRHWFLHDWVYRELWYRIGYGERSTYGQRTAVDSVPAPSGYTKFLY